MLVLVYRIVAEGSKKFPRIIIGVMVLLVAEGVLFVLMVTFQCRYVSHGYEALLLFCPFGSWFLVKGTLEESLD